MQIADNTKYKAKNYVFFVENQTKKIQKKGQAPYLRVAIKYFSSQLLHFFFQIRMCLIWITRIELYISLWINNH